MNEHGMNCLEQCLAHREQSTNDNTNSNNRIRRVGIYAKDRGRQRKILIL